MEAEAGSMVPAAQFLETKLKWAVTKYSETAAERRVRNWTESAKIIQSTYSQHGWDARVAGLDPVLLKDLNLDAAEKQRDGMTSLAARLSDICNVLQVALDVKNHGVFVPVPSMFGSECKRKVTSTFILAKLVLEELSTTKSDHSFDHWVKNAIKHSKNNSSCARWFYSLGLGMVPLPLDDACVESVTREGELALSHGNELKKGIGNPEKLISLAYLLLACRATDLALVEILQCTGDDDVYSICKRKPKWRGHNDSLLESFNTPGLASAAKRFIYDDLYDVLLTLKHIRLRSMIKKSLVENERVIRREVAEYRSAGISLRRRLQVKHSLNGVEEKKLDILSLLNVKELDSRASGKLGAIGYYPEGLNEFMLTNLDHGDNDGTIAGKIGQDIFASVFGDEVDDMNPIRKINGYTARVLFCGKDVIVVEPIRRTLTVVPNDPEWGKELAPCVQVLEASVHTPRVRLAAELLLCSITGRKQQAFSFLKSKYRNNKISYEADEFRDAFMNGTVEGVEITASAVAKKLGSHSNNAFQAAVFRETLEMFSKYSRGLAVAHSEGKGSYEKVLYYQGRRGTVDKLDLDIPVPLIGVVLNNVDGYIFAHDIVFDCVLEKVDDERMSTTITGSRKLKDRKGLTASWRVDV